MKMRLIPVVYFGFAAMDRRFSSPMLPWIFSEIRKREHREKLSLGVEDGCLQAYNQDFEVQFSHKLNMLTRFSQADADACTFLYLLRDDVEQLLYCYLFAACKPTDVHELYQQMKDSQATPRSAPTSSNLTSLCVDISPSCSNFFEVLYIGKIKVWHKKVPDSFIDDALDKFRQHDLEKNRKKLARLKSEMDLRRGSVDAACRAPDARPPSPGGVPRLQRSRSLLANLGVKSPDVDRKVPTCVERISEGNDDEEEQEAAVAVADADEEWRSSLEREKEELRKLSAEQPPPADDLERLERQLAASASDEHNRTMVLQVDRTDLRLISPDRKVILLHKRHKDVATCVQGATHARHFGFIAREPSHAGTVATYIGFVFKCESASVASEAVAAITQAFGAQGARDDVHRPRATITSCDRCPMVWFHRLCSEIEAMPERKQQAAIVRRVDQLDEEEQTLIMAKFRGAETDSLRDRNEFLMMLLRAHCEMKQARHQHDTAAQRSEFLNQYLGGGNTIFMKAKRSLSNGFEHLLKRRGSRDDFAAAAATRELVKDLTLSVRAVSPKPARADEDAKSPMMDIFMKVGSTTSPMPNTPGSWRQAIFKRVTTAAKPRLEGHTYTREELRQLWKRSIHQAILLVRMEKENARIRAKQEESAVKRIKLDYDELREKPGGENSEASWDLIGSNRDKPDSELLRQAIKQGVPKGKRGDVWHHLAEQFCAHLPPPACDTPYETLLKQLTAHQHAILIDLGRTFPGHPYYASPLGPGQLALFNLLKAYSLLDPEVGYCQGLSFVAGVLLLHMDEPSAFFLLRHLMHRRHLRQQYLPDMVGLQIKLYQLSRLLRDRLPDVYDHLDAHEVAPTLYAAPWLLTMFASQFPLGFVTRVFDLIFLEDADVIFRVILALLAHHRHRIIACDSFEDIMDYLKNVLPQIDAPGQLDAIVRDACATDVARQLHVYQVEYNVLQEEMQGVQNQLETFQRAQTQLGRAQEQIKCVGLQLEAALGDVARLEQARTTQQASVTRLEATNRSMEATILTLGAYLHKLVQANAHIQPPGEVRRILDQIPVEGPPKERNNLFNNLFSKPHVNPKLALGRAERQDDDALRANSLNVNSRQSSFFSDPHRDILNNQHRTGQQDGPVSPDSGVSTPVAHQDVIEESEEDCVNNNNGDTTTQPQRKGPPLNHCDLNVTYNHRELKKVRSVRDMSRHSGPASNVAQ